MGLKIGGRIEKVNAREPTYSEFVEKYMAPNQPVVLTGLMDDWRACKDWVSPNGKPNLHFFSTHFGKSIVQVADCGTREFTDHKRIEMTVSEFVDHWLRDCGASDGSLLYLKDWHFVKVLRQILNGGAWLWRRNSGDSIMASCHDKRLNIMQTALRGKLVIRSRRGWGWGWGWGRGLGPGWGCEDGSVIYDGLNKVFTKLVDYPEIEKVALIETGTIDMTKYGNIVLATASTIGAPTSLLPPYLFRLISVSSYVENITPLASFV